MHEVVLVHHKPSALHHGARHLEVLGSEVEVGQQHHQVSRQHLRVVRFRSHLPQPETTAATLLAGVRSVANDLVEERTSLLEVTGAEMHDTFVELVEDVNVEALQSVGV